MAISILIAGVIVSAGLTLFVRLYSLKFNVLDTPVARSSHSVPTPRGGGLSIAITFALLLILCVYLNYLDWQYFFALILPSVIVATIGFIDDHRSIDSRYRLLIHFIAAGLALYLIPQLPVISIGEFEIKHRFVIYPLYAIGLVWLLNLYNFMDGIDGIASIEGITVLICAATILFLINEPTWALLLLWFSGPILGFLIWNWSPAKIFMGDIGSGFLGIIIGVITLITAFETSLTIWSWLILLATFISDSTWTLVTRIRTAQKWSSAHHSHAYQILSRRYQSHAKVSLSVIIVNLVWLLPLAYVETQYQKYGLVITLIAYLPLLVICYQTGAGRKNALLM
jgi:Fuc2NAc and GlcNAc transferase